MRDLEAFTVRLETWDASLCSTLAYDKKDERPRVSRLPENWPGDEVRIGDVILKINGQVCIGQATTEELMGKTVGPVELSIHRPEIKGFDDLCQPVSVQVPEGAPEGSRFAATLPDGEAIMVMVPVGAKAGDTLEVRMLWGMRLGTDGNLFAKEKAERSGEHKEPDVVMVLMKGLLKKRSPKGVAGLHPWQTRWFELTERRLTYYEVSGAVAIERGSLELTDLVRAAVSSGKASSSQFYVEVVGGRMLALSVPVNGAYGPKDWVDKIQLAIHGVQQFASGRSSGGEQAGRARSSTDALQSLQSMSHLASEELAAAEHPHEPAVTPEEDSCSSTSLIAEAKRRSIQAKPLVEGTTPPMLTTDAIYLDDRDSPAGGD